MKMKIFAIMMMVIVAFSTQRLARAETYSPGQPTEELYTADIFHPITVALFSGAEAGKKAVAIGERDLGGTAIKEFNKAKWLAGNHNTWMKMLGKERIKLLFVKGFAYGVMGEVPGNPGGIMESKGGVQGYISGETGTRFLGWSGGNEYLETYAQAINAPLTANTSMAAANSQITATKLPGLLAKSIFYGAYSPKGGAVNSFNFPTEESFLIKLSSVSPDLFALYIDLVDQMPAYSKQAEDRMYENDHPWIRARGHWIAGIIGAYVTDNPRNWSQSWADLRNYTKLLEKEESGAPLCTHKNYSGFNLFEQLRNNTGPSDELERALEKRYLLSPSTVLDSLSDKVENILKERYGTAQNELWGQYKDLFTKFSDRYSKSNPKSTWIGIEKKDRRQKDFLQCMEYYSSDALLEMAEDSNNDSLQWVISLAYYKAKNYVEAEKWFNKSFNNGSKGKLAAEVLNLFRERRH